MYYKDNFCDNHCSPLSWRTPNKECCPPSVALNFQNIALCTRNRNCVAGQLSQINPNATMYREAGARRGVHFNPECPHSVLPSVWAWTKEWAQEQGIQVQELVISWVWRWGDWSSHSCQTLCWIQLNMLAEVLSSKYILYKYEIIHAWYIRFELLSHAIISDWHTTKAIHKI